MTTFTGTKASDVASIFGPTLTGFTGGTLKQLTDGTGDTFYGVDASDTIKAGSGNDTVFGGAGDDMIQGGGGFDSMYGGSGNDWLYTFDFTGNYNFDMTTGVTSLSSRGEEAHQFENAITGAGNDNITGTNGPNLIYSLGGNDTINGAGGIDRLDGGWGNDELTGGAQSDSFVFSASPSPSFKAIITDFCHLDDTIELEDLAFVTLAPGALSPSAFRAGASAADASDRIIYNAVTGNLFFDLDGTGTVAQVGFADVLPGTVIDVSDFLIF